MIPLYFPRRPRLSPGFTLIELLVVIAIAAILMVVVVPSMVTFKRNAELTSVSNGLIASINAARGEAIKFGMSALVIPKNGSDWNSGWVIFVDRNRNGTYEPGTDLTIAVHDFDAGGTLSISSSAAALTFDSSGYSKNGAGFASATLTVMRNDSDPDQVRRIKIAQTGRLRVCKPASSADLDCSDTKED